MLVRGRGGATSGGGGPQGTFFSSKRTGRKFAVGVPEHPAAGPALDRGSNLVAHLLGAIGRIPHGEVLQPGTDLQDHAWDLRCRRVHSDLQSLVWLLIGGLIHAKGS